MAELYDLARKVRWHIIGQVRADGTCPSTSALCAQFDLDPATLGRVLFDLEAAGAIAVTDAAHAHAPTFQDEPVSGPLPALGEVFYARPFATFPNHYRITVDGEQKWYGECAVEACGISSSFPGREVTVTSICRQSGTPVEITGRDGVVLDFKPKSLLVHFGIPFRRIAEDMIGWCDFNSFFASQDAYRAWCAAHPQIRGRTRDPVTVNRQVQIVGKGRLDYDYQLTLPVLRMIAGMKALGFTHPLCGCSWLHVPDPFFAITPATIRAWKARGYGNYVRLALL
ncbi:MAG: alkylmercury lyase family protein [Gammaproteobacteria bacterium]|nr:alkylmercury lyase family protein [Gammaproteobacteria bacterium]